MARIPVAEHADGWRSDTLAVQIANFAFSVAQAMTAVIVPLLAITAGHGIEIIGVIVAVSAISQTAARLGLGRLMTLLPTRIFVVMATILLAASCILLASSDALWAFIVSQLLQGAARAYFWTGSQTHVVRTADSAVSALARLNVVQGVGQLVGPALAGLIGVWSLEVALLAAGGLAAFATVPACFLTRFDPFAPAKRPGRRRENRIWLRPGVGAAANMTACAGAWRGILNSYLPVILTAAGHSVASVGALVTVANLAALGGSAASARVMALGQRAVSGITILAAGLGLATAAFFPATLAVVICGLVISGAGAGILQTVGPALAADSVGAEERGSAIAAIGAFRSVALLASPLAAAGLVLLLPTAAIATGLAGILVAAPAAAVFRSANRPGKRE
ncbi:MFS transporter [Cryobacterium glaciale]|uniref:MFS transporter n=1 Tax=Cryobacterium glaciale TaxID=1259145 RepID=A0A4R8V180_9MICO|nr:MFS transporter [Cryobacterium glaciale]TFB75023.1 MFS transporter [Cryobacterium glaciale]